MAERKLRVTIAKDIDDAVATALMGAVLRDYANVKPKNQFSIWSVGDVNATIWRNKQSVSVYIWRTGK